MGIRWQRYPGSQFKHISKHNWLGYLTEESSGWKVHAWATPEGYWWRPFGQRHSLPPPEQGMGPFKTLKACAQAYLAKDAAARLAGGPTWRITLLT